MISPKNKLYCIDAYIYTSTQAGCDVRSFLSGDLIDFNQSFASPRLFDCWLGGWLILYINLCSLYNAKSIFMQIIGAISNGLV